jgi:hypothetical protein
LLFLNLEVHLKINQINIKFNDKINHPQSQIA